MKQLKFMLAAATAISLATAAQADTQLEKTEISSENFDAVTTLEDTAALMALDGFTYEGATATDNESYVVAGGADNTANALKVNTGTDPLLRKIDTDSNNAVTLDSTGVKKVYIDTMVQFTVTPNGDTVTKSDDDKLMIYLKEDLSDADAPKTNLVVKAGYKGAGTLEAKDYVLDIDGKKVLPDVWYSLKVVAYGNVAAVGEGMDVYPAFEIYIDDTLARIANAGSCTDLQVPDNVPIFLLGSFSERLSAGTLFLSMQVNSSTLDKVGFAGEGKVDELVFSQDVEQETSVDFTFTWTDSKISAVTYSIGEVTDQKVTKDDEVTGLKAGSVITLTITPADWYKLASAETITYTVPNATPAESVSLDNYVTEAAKVEEGNKITVSETTAPSDLGIAPGSSFYADKASADAAANLSKAMTWAMKSGGATSATKAAEVVNALVFEDDTETEQEQAYLLDCSTEELDGEDGEIAKFKFVGFDLANGGFTVGKDKKVGDGVSYGNGYVEVRGSATIGGAYDEAADAAKHNFFKAFLVPFAPTK